MAHLPEDRIKMGIVLPFSVAGNMILHEYNHAPYARGGFLSFGVISNHARDLVGKFDVRTASVDTRNRQPVGWEPAEGRGGTRAR